MLPEVTWTRVRPSDEEIVRSTALRDVKLSHHRRRRYLRLRHHLQAARKKKHQYAFKCIQNTRTAHHCFDKTLSAEKAQETNEKKEEKEELQGNQESKKEA